jgi:hypothetical protein
MMKAASTFETLIKFCQTTRRNNPEDDHLCKCFLCDGHDIKEDIYQKLLSPVEDMVAANITVNTEV